MFEDAAALADYCVGKTAEEVAAIELDESGHATDADVLAARTITVTRSSRRLSPLRERAGPRAKRPTNWRRCGSGSCQQIQGRDRGCHGVGFAYAYYTAYPTF
jgi:hypothetical protein